jgi:hypothetical protein
VIFQRKFIYSVSVSAPHIIVFRRRGLRDIVSFHRSKISISDHFLFFQKALICKIHHAQSLPLPQHNHQQGPTIPLPSHPNIRPPSTSTSTQNSPPGPLDAPCRSDWNQFTRNITTLGIRNLACISNPEIRRWSKDPKSSQCSTRGIYRIAYLLKG